jgi:hypothetical protein
MLVVYEEAIPQIGLCSLFYYILGLFLPFLLVYMQNIQQINLSYVLCTIDYYMYW